jgi:hypothetical protein
MGRATDAILAYGYDLGGPAGEWKVQETDEYGGLTGIDWYDEDDDDTDFVGSAQQQLLARLAGFTETWTTDARANGFYDRRDAAEARVRVKVARHCADTAPAYLLAVDVTTAHRGEPVVIDFDDLTRSQLAGDWDDQLATALRALGLTPLQVAPAWLLASYADGF